MNICSTHLKLKKCLTYDFENWDATCNISSETVELRIWMTLMRICGEQDC